MSVQTKAAVTVSEMARMVGLSRARFYQLMNAGVFPQPVYDVATRRPIFVEELQKICLEVRRRNCGVNGRPVLFYSKGAEHPLGRQKKRKTKRKQRHAGLIASLQELGLADVTEQQVQSAINSLFPSGTGETDDGQVLRQVFLHLKRQNSTDNVGR